MAVLAWGAFKPTFATNAALLAAFLTQRYLLPVRAWPLTRGIARWLMTTATDAAQRDFARVLAALSAKRRGDEAEVRALCEGWDPATPDLVLIRHVLLGQMDDAFENARQQLAAGLLTGYELDTSPGLADLRDDPRWSELRTSAEQRGTGAKRGSS